jgi:hypothetical protein
LGEHDAGKVVGKLNVLEYHWIARLAIAIPSKRIAALAAIFAAKYAATAYVIAEVAANYALKGSGIYAADRRSAALRYTDGSTPRTAVITVQEG